MRTFTIKTGLALLLNLAFFTTLAQEGSPERCGTVEYNKVLQQIHPERGTDEEFESWISEKIRILKEERIANPRSTNEIITIPVVIHIIHNGDAVGSGENITDAQAISQIVVMNEDYRRLLGSRGYNDHPDGADIEIEFCLAQEDPDGNETNGIDRKQLFGVEWTRPNIEGIVKPQTSWDPTKYLNMWTVRFSDPLLLGYAQFPAGSGLEGIPGSGAANTDGVVAAYNAFGSIDHDDGTFTMNATYQYGRTMTHEVGHWLGLRHTWGDNWAQGDPSNQSCDVDDYCDDTPNSGRPQFGCPTGADTCPSGGVDMIENYMDYTNDTCMNIFTQDQKLRMLTVMQNSPRRSELATSDVCGSVGVEDFSFESFLVYPNPSTGVFNVTLQSKNSDNIQVQLIDMQGRIIDQRNIDTNDSSINAKIDYSAIDTGIYILKVAKGNQIGVRQIVIK